MATVDESGLTTKQREFTALYLKNGNATAAYKAVYNVKTMKDTTINVAASKLLANAKIQSVIAAHREQASVAVTFGVADALKELVDIVTADPGELMAHRRLCCRYCYGRSHKYQWKDQQEFAEACAARIDMNARAKKGYERAPPSDIGGYGYNHTLPPSPDCPQCHGEGHSDAWFADTRYLSPKGRKLFAGVQVTKDGLKILTRNQDAALQMLLKSLGMLKDNDTPPGTPGAPLPPAGVTITVPIDPMEAARLYAQIMKGTK